jgi:molybdenum cofactor cytidylyltransferase
MMIPALVLAAGRSTRMGRPKANLPVDSSDTFLTRVIRTLQDAEVEDIVVVLGSESAVIARSVEQSGLSARLVVNEQYDCGQLSSLIVGLRAIDRPGVRGMLVALVDMPLLSAATVTAVLERYRVTAAPIVRPVSGGRHGHPVLFDRSLFASIRSADLGRGVKPVVRAHASPAGDVEIEDEGAFLDIDTPEDYVRAVQSKS